MANSLNLKILFAAQLELDEIALMHNQLVGPESAKKITNKLLNSISRLIDYPQMGMLITDRELRMLEYRKLVCDNYLVFYRKIADTIFVYHIVDGRSDYPRLFSDSKNESNMDSGT